MNQCNMKYKPSNHCVFIPDLLGKSMQVLSSSSVLLQKLRQLQRTEALQRRGGVLQEEEAEEEVRKCHIFIKVVAIFLY